MEWIEGLIGTLIGVLIGFVVSILTLRFNYKQLFAQKESGLDLPIRQ